MGGPSRLWPAVILLGGMAAAEARAEDLLVPVEFPTIQEAVDAALPGDRILVSPGRYRGPVDVRTPDITLEGDGAVLLRRRRSGGMVVLADGVTVKGFEFRGTSLFLSGRDGVAEGNTVFRPRTGFGIDAVGDGAILRGNTVGAARGSRDGRDPWGALTAEGDGAVVEGNTVEGSLRVDSIRVTGDDAVVRDNDVRMVAAGTGISVEGRRCTVADNRVDDVGMAARVRGRLVLPSSNVFDPTVGRPGPAPRFNMLRPCPGILVRGEDARITGNAVRFWASQGVVTEEGDGSLVEGNTAHLLGTAGTGFLLSGTGVRIHGNVSEGAPLSWHDLELWWGNPLPSEIVGNTVSGDGTGGVALELSGYGVLVRGNLVEGYAGTGVLLEGREFDVRENEIRDAAPGSVAAVVTTSTFADSVIEGNQVRDFDGAGLLLRGQRNVVRDCVFSGGRTADGAAVDIEIGTDHVVEECATSANAGTGFTVRERAGNTVLRRCTAQGNGGCGLDNSGSATVVTGSTFTGSGIQDIRNDGTIDVFEGNRFDTGGPLAR